MELIDRDNLWNKVFSHPFGWSNEDVVSELKIAPTVDAVPVVRCGECKHGKNNEFGAVVCRLVNCVARHADDFCSYGEQGAE